VFSSRDHVHEGLVAWRPDEPGWRINDHILVSPASSYAYAVVGDDADVIINTGTWYQGARSRERFEELLGRPLNVEAIIFTQSHPDHIGGWSAFHSDSTETIAQQNFRDGRLDRTLLPQYLPPRSRRIVGPVQAPEYRDRWLTDTVEPTITKTFANAYAFVSGGRRFELFATPGGETLDSLIVWLPEERTVFIGNMMGFAFGMLPNLSTIRGDRLRSARLFLRSVDTVLALKPELLITGHQEPVRGYPEIEQRVRRVRDAVQYLHDETIKGMNDGKDLFTLMREIDLPEDLHPAPGRCPVRWVVRAIWEEHSGWFRFESTTELYAVPQRAVWPEMAELMGGLDVLATAAEGHVKQGQAIEALHFTDIALAVDPAHERTRRAQIAALMQLLEETEGEPYDELRWLETEIELAHAALGESAEVAG
jgi:alkyl sulfatase BDS1-like metallo-beta-lactamase superfamily hydrolase